jgi:hypothetical protein
MWEPWRLATLWASVTCYMDIFTLSPWWHVGWNEDTIYRWDRAPSTHWVDANKIKKIKSIPANWTPSLVCCERPVITAVSLFWENNRGLRDHHAVFVSTLYAIHWRRLPTTFVCTHAHGPSLAANDVSWQVSSLHGGPLPPIFRQNSFSQFWHLIHHLLAFLRGQETYPSIVFWSSAKPETYLHTLHLHDKTAGNVGTYAMTTPQTFLLLVYLDGPGYIPDRARFSFLQSPHQLQPPGLFPRQ